MRRVTSLVTLAAVVGFAATATARPEAVGRVGMVARGELDANAIGWAGRDGRAQVTVRADGGADALRRAGFDATPLAGGIASLRATSSELRRLLTLSMVQTVEERRILHPLLDASGPAIGAPAARAETGLDGSGVLIAFVDTGLDYRHADFRHADGTTRVAALLDLSLARGSLHPELPDYGGGALWLRADIDMLLAAEAAGQASLAQISEADRVGHGTHVAGIAASNGLATGNGLPAGRYVGVAPNADVIAIQDTHEDGSFDDASVLTGCQFALDQARRLQEPVVINLSVGGPGGPHDGTTNLELGLAKLFQPDDQGPAVSGALVIAAGNDGLLDQHAGAWALDGSVRLPVGLGVSQDADAQLAFDVWYTGSLSISVVSPSGRHSGPVAQGKVYNGPPYAEGQVLIDNGLGMDRRPDGRQGANIAIVGPAGGAPAAGTWTIVLEGQAPRWDLWLSQEPSAATHALFLTRTSEDDRLAIPAATTDAVIVGSFVTRNQWIDVDGTSITRAAIIGEPSTFSSTGPTSDGRFAPDVLAPGELVVSALSQDALPDAPGSLFYSPTDAHANWADDGVHGVLRGTSQATPHVAGALALMLQANPTLSQAALREILRVTAHDGGRGYTPRFGFGNLDVLAALRYARGGRGTAVSPTKSSVGVSRDLVPPGDETSTVSVTPRADDGTALGPGHLVTIAASAGEASGDVIDLGGGRYERTFAAHAARGSVAVVSATVDGIALAAHPSIYIVTSRADIGGDFTAGGGCSLTRTTAAPTGLGGILLLLALCRATKSRRRRDFRTLGR
jgi:subtilisin family serine protease